MVHKGGNLPWQPPVLNAASIKGIIGSLLESHPGIELFPTASVGEIIPQSFITIPFPIRENPGRVGRQDLVCIICHHGLRQLKVQIIILEKLKYSIHTIAEVIRAIHANPGGKDAPQVTTWIKYLSHLPELG